MNLSFLLGKKGLLLLLVIVSLSSCGTFSGNRVSGGKDRPSPFKPLRPKPPRPKPPTPNETPEEVAFPEEAPIPEEAPPVPEEAPAPSGMAAEVRLRNDMVEFGKRYLGTRYQYGGRTPASGFDCSGFTCYVYQQFGLKLSSTSRSQAQDGKKINPKDAKPGDLIIFGKQGNINHVAIVVEVKNNGIHVIHSTSRGVVVDNVSQSSYWKPRIMYGRRVLGN
jgi:cell wall-associated NlpC family hydrolase